jgi:hypothetical protein
MQMEEYEPKGARDEGAQEGSGCEGVHVECCLKEDLV